VPWARVDAALILLAWRLNARLSNAFQRPA
jgi:hypothetical protein